MIQRKTKWLAKTCVSRGQLRRLGKIFCCKSWDQVLLRSFVYTSFVYTETITIFDLRDRSRIFTSISKNTVASYQFLSSLTSFGLRLLSQYFTL